MRKEDKELLVKDLCARLPYGVMVSVQYKDGDGWKTEDRRILGVYEDGQVYLDCVHTTVDCIKPYLRPMSSMSEEEYKEFKACHCLYDLHPDFQPMMCTIMNERNMFDWLDKNYFDYHGLISKGLAIEVTKENNPYKYVIW